MNKKAIAAAIFLALFLPIAFNQCADNSVLQNEDQSSTGQALSIVLTDSTVNEGGSIGVQVYGGVKPYAYSANLIGGVSAGNFTIIDDHTATFSATKAGVTQIVVTDKNLLSKSLPLTINSSGTADLTFTAPPNWVYVGDTLALSLSGGSGTGYSILNSNTDAGELIGLTGFKGKAVGIANLTASDSSLLTKMITVVVRSKMVVSSQFPSVSKTGTSQLTVTGGVPNSTGPAYTFTVSPSAAGSVNDATKVFTAGNTEGTVVVTAKDSLGQEKSVNIEVLPGPAMGVATVFSTVTSGVNYSVPAGTTKVRVRAWGAGGGGAGKGLNGTSGNGGGGGYIDCDVNLTSTQTNLLVRVGGGGGGGNPGNSNNQDTTGGGGGGYSGVFIGTTRLVIAGGGGGGGGADLGFTGGNGGAGGSALGQNGGAGSSISTGGKGGSDTAAGANGTGQVVSSTVAGNLFGGSGAGGNSSALGGSGGVNGGGPGGKAKLGAGGGGAGHRGGGGGGTAWPGYVPVSASGGGGGSSFCRSTDKINSNLRGVGTNAGAPGPSEHPNRGDGGVGATLGSAMGENGKSGLVIITPYQ